jgi:hypothetical protein
MKQKFNRISEFVNSLESKELSSWQQALLLVGGTAAVDQEKGNNCKCNGDNCNCKTKKADFQECI